MRNCPLPDLLLEYVDDLLSSQERHAVEAHLHTCVECRGEAESFRMWTGHLRRLGSNADPIPIGLGVATRRRLYSVASPKTRRSYTFSAAAALLLVAAGLIWVAADPRTAKTKPALNLDAGSGRGVVELLAGGCETRIRPDMSWRPMEGPGTRPFDGAMEIRAGRNRAKLLVGKSAVYLENQAESAVVAQPDSHRFFLLLGTGVFDFTRGGGTVETFHGSIEAAGARIGVEAREDDTVVTVLEGTANLSSGSLGRISFGPADGAAKFRWTRELEENHWLEAEQGEFRSSMTVVADPAASGGRALKLSQAPADVQGLWSGDVQYRVNRVQVVPNAIWARIYWNAASARGDIGLHVQPGREPGFCPHDVQAGPEWRWIRVGVFDSPRRSVPLVLTVYDSPVLIDRILLTSDLQFDPASR